MNRTQQNKIRLRLRRKVRVRKKVKGTSERPRLSVFRSNKYIYAQVIDDVRGVTLASASSRDVGSSNNKAAAQAVGKLVAERAKQASVVQVVFDRNGYIYHGRVKALAEAVREQGLKF